MKNTRIILAAALLVFAGLLATAAAEEKFDPAARAKIVAPFIQPQTFAVVHIDLARVAANPLFDTLGRLIPRAPEEMEEVMNDARNMLRNGVARLTKLGVHEAYLVFSMPFLPPQPPLAFLVARPGIDVEAVRAAVPIFTMAPKRVGDVLILADREESLARIDAIRPEVRPELTAAFAAAGDTAVQAFFFPPRHFARVVEETYPELPPEIGGGPSTILTHGMRWAALGIDLPPQLSARLVVQAQDAAAAEALLRTAHGARHYLAGLPETKKQVPNFDQAAGKLMPQVEKDRLVVVLDSAGADAVLELLRPAAWR